MKHQELSKVVKRTKNGGEILGHGMFQYSLKSWDDFYPLVKRYFNNSNYIFRGQPSSHFICDSNGVKKEVNTSLIPSILREIANLQLTDEAYTKLLKAQLKEFRESIKGKTNIYDILLKEDDEAWALGQHYGLKTPLLDFTLSPYFAVFFALSQSHSNSSIYAVSKQIAKTNGAIEIYSPKTDHNRRLLSQSGLFVKFNKPTSIESVIKETVEDDCTEIKLVKIIINEKCRKDALAHLKSMNITYQSLFPDLEGASKHVNQIFMDIVKKLSERRQNNS